MNFSKCFPRHLLLWGAMSVGLVGTWGQSPAIAELMRVSWYGPGFEGSYTASGEVFSRYELTAAHPTWPFDTVLLLTNIETGDHVTVRINDRSGGALDISEQAARDLGTYDTGIAPVNVEIVEWGTE